MALIHSKYTQGALRVPAPQVAGEVVGIRYAHVLTAAQNVTNNIIELAILPAHARALDLILDCDDLDSVTALVLDVGIMSGKPGEALDEAGSARTCGDEYFDGITTGQAGGVVRPTLAKAFRVDPVPYDRAIGVKIVTQSATAVQGTIGLTVLASA